MDTAAVMVVRLSFAMCAMYPAEDGRLQDVPFTFQLLYLPSSADCVFPPAQSSASVRTNGRSSPGILSGGADAAWTERNSLATLFTSDSFSPGNDPTGLSPPAGEGKASEGARRIKTRGRKVTSVCAGGVGGRG